MGHQVVRHRAAVSALRASESGLVAGMRGGHKVFQVVKADIDAVRRNLGK